jgi:hypothetical protein
MDAGMRHWAWTYYGTPPTICDANQHLFERG